MIRLPSSGPPRLVQVVERAIQITTPAFQVQACARVSGVADPFNGHQRDSWVP
jgi:hypothetical protein